MPRISNGNLIAMKWQNIHMISNICFKQRKREKERETHTHRESKTWPSSLLYIQQRGIQNSFQNLSKEVISLEVAIFTKISILDV